MRSLKRAKAAAKSASILSGNMSAFPQNRPYHLEFHDAETGAKVVRPEGWTPSNEHEIPTAKALAVNGIDTVFRIPVAQAADKSTEGIKNADALLRIDGEWKPFDFKAIGNQTNDMKQSAQRMARDARKQSGNVVFFLARKFRADESVEDINRGLAAAIFHDQPPLRGTIILLAADGKIQRVEASTFNDTRKRFSGF